MQVLQVTSVSDNDTATFYYQDIQTVNCKLYFDYYFLLTCVSVLGIIFYYFLKCA